MPAKTVNVALIGSKFMGRAHSNAFLKVAKFFDLPAEPVMHTLVARDPGYTKSFASRWGWQHASTDWKSVVSNPEIDLIDIGVPNNVHRDMAIAALEAGKHVACEKPLAASLDDARAMVKAAKKAKNLHTFVWYNYRRCPAVALAHQLVQEGKLGQIFHVRAAYLQDWGGPDTPMLWRFDSGVAGSGALGDLCAHSIDTARFITGQEISEVNGAYLETVVKERRVISGDAGGEIAGKGAKTATKTARSTVDDIVVFTARTTGGAVCTFEATRLATGYKNGNRIEIHGERGGISFNFERMNELNFYDATQPGRLQGWTTINVTRGGDGHPYAGAWWPASHVLGYEHGFVNMAADIINMIAGRKPVVPMPDFADAYETQRVLEAATISARNRSAVKMSQVK